VDHRFRAGAVRHVAPHRPAFEPGGWAGHGCCASHSRFCWGLRLYLVCTPPACRSCGHWPTPSSTSGRP
jgi:hypothetical protein